MTVTALRWLCCFTPTRTAVCLSWSSYAGTRETFSGHVGKRLGCSSSLRQRGARITSTLIAQFGRQRLMRSRGMASGTPRRAFNGRQWFSKTRQGAEQFRQTYPELQEVVTTRVQRNVYDRSYRHPKHQQHWSWVLRSMRRPRNSSEALNARAMKTELSIDFLWVAPDLGGHSADPYSGI